MSFGEELRRERELREISLREISEATKISLRYLEALEHNEFTDLPGGVFNRGFVRAYAQFIGVDPESMVNAYLLEEQAQTGVKTGERKLLRRSRPITGQGAATSGRPAAGWLRWTLLVLALLIVAAGLYFVIRWSGSRATPAGGRPSPDGSAGHGAAATSTPTVAVRDVRRNDAGE